MIARLGAGLGWLRRESPLIAVLALAGIGFGGLGVFYAWRKGLYVIGGAVLVAALLRLLLPERRIGLLAVRSRWIDVLVLGVLALAILSLADVIPYVKPVDLTPSAR